MTKYYFEDEGPFEFSEVAQEADLITVPDKIDPDAAVSALQARIQDLKYVARDLQRDIYDHAASGVSKSDELEEVSKVIISLDKAVRIIQDTNRTAKS